MVGKTGFEPATPWPRTASETGAPVSPSGTRSQAVDPAAPPPEQESHRVTNSAYGLQAWTASGLRNSDGRYEARTADASHETKVQDLPAVQLALFLESGANIAAQAAEAGAGKERVEAILRRAAEQVAAVVAPADQKDR